MTPIYSKIFLCQTKEPAGTLLKREELVSYEIKAKAVKCRHFIFIIESSIID